MVAAILVAICLGLAWIASKSSYWILKVLDGFFWWALAFYWVQNPVIDDANMKNILLMVLIGVGIACMFWPFWTSQRDSKGFETGNGRLRLPFMRTDEQEEEFQKSRYSPNRRERNATYAERINRRLGR
jgi:hypothetical protein